MLKINDLTTHYGSSQALFGVVLDIMTGEVATLLGRNGMGKTTTINSIMGIVPASGGSILFDDAELVGRASFKTANLGIGLVPEGRQIFPNLSLMENLVATASNHLGRDDPWTVEKIFDLFPELAERRRSMGNLLSGGEQQMLAIGRALMTNPKMLILDEATEG
ncbi:MAG: ATP-binding cassette domain-containing protein, partial [Hyphomicrobiales bacterium]|nr:ATP-binding cassette domain-containing protein [Hyphomicrobiales bacterium]